MKRVIVVGSAVMDVLVKSSGLKVMKSHQVAGGVAISEVYGGKSEAEEIILETGGAGTNVAVGLSRLGHLGCVISRVGDDWIKQRIFDQLSVEGVVTSEIQTDKKGRSGMSVVLIAGDGGRSILTYRGVSGNLKKEEIDWGHLGDMDWLHLSSVGGDMFLVEDILSYCQKKGVRVSWNPGKKEIQHKEHLIKLLKNIELLVLNKMEASQLLTHDYEKSLEMGKRLCELGAKIVAITDGKRGAVIAGEGRVLKSDSLKLKSIDDTGAGDAFCAGMISGLLEKEELNKCLKMGLVNGASVVTKIGAKVGLLKKPEMVKLLKKKLSVLDQDWSSL